MYEEEDQELPLEFEQPQTRIHGVVMNRFGWLCKQPNCDGEHHYYEKIWDRQAKPA